MGYVWRQFHGSSHRTTGAEPSSLDRRGSGLKATTLIACTTLCHSFYRSSRDIFFLYILNELTRYFDQAANPNSGKCSIIIQSGAVDRRSSTFPLFHPKKEKFYTSHPFIVIVTLEGVSLTWAYYMISHLCRYSRSASFFGKALPGFWCRPPFCPK